jgi:hypothetical protein
MAWTGRWVDTETFSFTAGGRPWEDTEWLFHGFLFPLQRLGGDPLLIVFTALAGILALLQVYRLVRLAGGGVLAFSLATLTILPAVADRVRCRPDLVTFLFMGVLAEVLWRNLPEGRSAAPPFLRPGPAWKDLALMLALLFGLWANLHGGWAYGAAMLAAFLAGTLLDRLAARDLRWGDIGRCTLAGLAALLALFLTPYTWRIPWFPIKHVIAMMDTSLVPIEEWNRTPLIEYRGVLLALSGILLLVMAARRRPLALLLPASLQVVLSLLWVRYPAQGFLILAPLAVREILAFRIRWPSWGRIAIQWAGWSAVLCGAILLGYRAWPDARLKWDLSFMYPEAEVRFLQENHVQGKLLNPYTSGGYLDWHYYPLGKIFMDGRYFPFTSDLSDYFQSLRSVDGFRRFLDRRGIELALHPYPDYTMPPDRPGGPPRGVFRQLFPAEQWAAVCYGNWGGLFLRRIPRWEDLIARGEYRVMSPDDALYLRWAARRGEVDRDLLKAEVKRCLNGAGRIPSRTDLEKVMVACGGP